MGIHNYGKQLLAEIATPDNNRPTSPVPQATAPTKSPSRSIIDLPLSALHIDPHQPRQFLPDALRQQLTHDPATAHEVLLQLINDASKGNLAASGYLDSIRSLASSLQSVELQQPITVSPANTHGCYPIIDGERRYWAALYLALQQVSPGGDVTEQLQRSTLPAIVNTNLSSADDITRAQWASNLQREDISAIDFATAIARVHADCALRLDTDPRPHLAELGTNFERTTPREVAYALTEREVQRLTGKPLARRTLYVYLALAEKLCPEAQALACAHRISVNRLEGIVRLNPSDQLAAIFKWLQPTPDDAPATEPDTPPKGQGRPTGLQRGINLCVTLRQVLGKLSDKHLARHTPEEQQALLDELTQVGQHIEQAKQRTRAQLNL